jgi:hypothetical protein
MGTPVETDFFVGKDGAFLAKEKGGTFDPLAFAKATDEYNEAYNFDSELHTMVLPQIRWTRGGTSINHEVTQRFVRNGIGK